MQSVLQLLGAVEEEALFRLCDLVVDRDTAGALEFLEELSEQGQDLGRLVTDLLEHLRHLMLVQHMGEVPESLPVTEETRERLREQANQLGEATVMRLIDLLHAAVEDMRQGGDPRLPLELALVKATRPGSDLSRESLAHRLELLEERPRVPRRRPAPAAAARGRRAGAAAAAEPAAEPSAASGSSSCRRRGSGRSCRPSAQRSIPLSSVLAGGAPRRARRGHADARVPADAPRSTAASPRSRRTRRALREALFEVTGRRLGVVFALGSGQQRVTSAAEPDGRRKDDCSS